MSDKLKGLLSRKIFLGTSLGVALFFMLVGVIFWGGFNTAMEATNTMDFCISCHEMKDNVYKEFTTTAHYANRSGVQASCSDCHVPQAWGHKMVRKIQASREVWHKMLGTINTPEKFDKKRLVLAERVWKSMKKTDSRECRNCHDFGDMDPRDQQRRSRNQHLFAMEQGHTCIDCHKGIAHKHVHDDLDEEWLANLDKPNPRLVRPLPPLWAAYKSGELEMPAEASAAAPMVAAASTIGEADWSGIDAKEIVLFYPGEASMEWILNGRDHSGARVFRVAGDRCADCHLGEEKQFGENIVGGSVESTPIPGKRPYIAMNVQAQHDGEHLYMRFQWQDVEAHAPAPFADGGKMDPANPMKLALMLGNDDPSYAEQSGCWGSCHHDAVSMPHAPGQEVTKYLEDTRTEISLTGDQRGGWDKLKDAGEIEGMLKAGKFLDLLRYNAGEQTSEGGYVLDKRVMRTAGTEASFAAELNDGYWTVELKRKLAPGQEGDLDLDPGQIYNIGFAIHDDYADARFHHVSLGFKLGFDNPDAEINAVKK